MGTPGAGATCYRCASGLPRDESVGRGAICPSCGAEVRVCRNCAFYTAGAHNDCREPGAERVVEKERANFCEFFQLAVGRSGAPSCETGRTRDALDALFRKA